MKYIVAMSFPKQQKDLCLEPSILTVVPNDTEDTKVIYVLDQWNIDIPESDILYYIICAVYISQECMTFSNGAQTKIN